MAKIKKASNAKKISTEAPLVTTAYCCSHNTNLGTCWLCWLFKTLVFVICAFLLIWIGFCCGILQNQRMTYKMLPSEKNLRCQNSFCTPGDMSHIMSTNSREEIMGDPMMAALEGKTGAEFDREFLIQMTLHHEGGVEMAKLALEKSSDTEVRKLAQNIIDSQTKEIEQMKSWVK
ncbi:MAG TPA: DUF305 domain-containing protein [bacterium]|jgi:hypothetical protein|nr:DUF305 domain-containing protein [bacterium]